MSLQHPHKIVGIAATLVALSISAALPYVAFAQNKGADDPPANRPAVPAGIAKGEVVSELDKCISHVFQDSKNNYWFGSREAGLYRYDGKTITRFTTKDGLATNQVRGIQEDKSGNLFISTFEERITPPDPKPTCHRGIVKFDGRTFAQLTIPQTDSPDAAWKYQPDDLWFTGEQDSGVVYRYDGKSVYRLRLPRTVAGDKHLAKYPRSKYPNARYSPYDVFSIFKDSKGNLWFGTGNLGACRYDGQSHEWISKEELGIDPGEAVFGVRSIIEDKDGKFWFTNTWNRFDVNRDRSAGQSKGVLNFKKEKGIDNNSDDDDYFLSAVQDRNGDLWMATLGAGVWRYDGKQLVLYPVKHDDASIWVSSIYKDRQDNLWLGTQEHGVYRFNGKSFEKFKF